MENKNNRLNKNTIINGTVQILLSIFWIYHYAILLYQYHFTDILFAFMYPDWTLILFILMGVLGILTGAYVILGKKKIKTGYLQILGFLIIGIIIDLIVIS
ncbi:hypothetical protein BKP44_07265 [Formosa algae]|nr:hypothetical protein BKP44_07265 [Formosa algae]